MKTFGLLFIVSFSVPDSQAPVNIDDAKRAPLPHFRASRLQFGVEALGIQVARE
jgi:hypothetical protein